MTRQPRKAIALLVALTASGCPKERPPAPNPPAAGVVERAASTNSVEAPMNCVPDLCNDQPLLGEPIEVVSVASAAPEERGGVIPPGVYVMQESRMYTGPGGKAGPSREREKMTFTIGSDSRGSVLQVVGTHPNCPTNRETRLLEFEGVNVKSARVCPPCEGGAARCDEHVYLYTWDGTTLAVLAPFPDGTRHRRTFLRQPPR